MKTVKKEQAEKIVIEVTTDKDKEVIKQSKMFIENPEQFKAIDELQKQQLDKDKDEDEERLQNNNTLLIQARACDGRLLDRCCHLLLLYYFYIDEIICFKIWVIERSDICRCIRVFDGELLFITCNAQLMDASSR